MRAIRHLLVIILCSSICTPGVAEAGDIGKEVVPYIQMADDQYHCGDSLVIDLNYEGAFREEKLISASLQIKQAKKIILEAFLDWAPSPGGTRFCIDPSLLTGADIAVVYGNGCCTRSKWVFRLEDFSEVLRNRVYLKSIGSGDLGSEVSE